MQVNMYIPGGGNPLFVLSEYVLSDEQSVRSGYRTSLCSILNILYTVCLDQTPWQEGQFLRF